MLIFFYMLIKYDFLPVLHKPFKSALQPLFKGRFLPVNSLAPSHIKHIAVVKKRKEVTHIPSVRLIIVFDDLLAKTHVICYNITRKGNGGGCSDSFIEGGDFLMTVEICYILAFSILLLVYSDVGKNIKKK